MKAAPQTLGQVIRRRRIELALTQEELAERIGEGVRQSEVSRLERDRIVLPRRERLERIAKAIQMPVGELLAQSGWAGAMLPQSDHEPVDLLAREPESVESSWAADLQRLRDAIERAQYNCDQARMLLSRMPEPFVQR
jgi:transcriptional regulator with XRE-family HTH domain